MCRFCIGAAGVGLAFAGFVRREEGVEGGGWVGLEA